MNWIPSFENISVREDSEKTLKVKSAPNEWGVINEQIGLRSRIAYSDFDSEDPVRCYSAAKFGPCGHCLCPCFVV